MKRQLAFVVALSSMSLAASGEEMFVGEKNAPIALIEYGSLTCDACNYFHRAVLPSIQADYIDSGKVRYSYRHFPTGQAALQGAIAVQCAGDKYYEMLDKLYLSIEHWHEADNQNAMFVSQAKVLGIDSASYAQCLVDKQEKALLLAGQQEASQKYGVIGTPTFVINGQVVKGKRSFAQMQVLLNGASSNVDDRKQPAD